MKNRKRIGEISLLIQLLVLYLKSSPEFHCYVQKKTFDPFIYRQLDIQIKTLENINFNRQSNIQSQNKKKLMKTHFRWKSFQYQWNEWNEATLNRSKQQKMKNRKQSSIASLNLWWKKNTSASKFPNKNRLPIKFRQSEK